MTFEREGVITGLWEEVVAEHGGDLTGQTVAIRIETDAAPPPLRTPEEKARHFMEASKRIRERANARGRDPGLITRDMMYADDDEETESDR